MIRLVILLILVSCTSPDYYRSKQFKITQRKEESYKMYRKVHTIRFMCTPKSRRKSRTKYKPRYTN
jgi:hypothetical protein